MAGVDAGTEGGTSLKGEVMTKSTENPKEVQKPVIKQVHSVNGVIKRERKRQPNTLPTEEELTEKGE